jgi:signal transduction histidine kinase
MRPFELPLATNVPFEKRNGHGCWVTGQLMSPLNELVGQAENLARNFHRWYGDKKDKIDNSLQTMMELVQWSARMARNFAWLAKPDESDVAPTLEVYDNFVNLLIECARNVQGIAKAMGLNRVHVVGGPLAVLNNSIAIDSSLFKQAILNVLDNAVKYSDAGSEIQITGGKENGFGIIVITNWGIQLHENDIEQIFGHGYRTVEAKEKDGTGTGIGLGIARSIAQLHRGTLTASPSEKTDRGWKTSFVFKLPVSET